jgi:phosphate transport system protein
MERKFEEELEEIKQNLLSLGAKVERNFGDAITALVKRDPVLAEEVISRDPLVDLAEIQLDEHCFYMLARRQPVARDLRFVATALKIVKDLERVGDMASDIAEHVLALLRYPAVRPFPDIQEMGRLAQQMLRRALDAFIGRDAELARTVIADDDKVDELHVKIWDELVALLSEDRDSIPAAPHLFAIIKYLERLGDHSSNVAEMVVFLVEGKDIRHSEKIRAIREKLAAERRSGGY